LRHFPFWILELGLRVSGRREQAVPGLRRRLLGSLPQVCNCES
jgi:hypothetical protein